MLQLKKDLFLGIVSLLFFLSLYFFIIPYGIVNPESHDPGQIAPSSYPTWITVIGIGVSCLIIGSSLLTYFSIKKAETDTEEVSETFFSKNLFKIFLAVFSLLIFYFFIQQIGIVLGSFLLYIIIALLAGEKNLFRLFAVNIILSALIYFFFVHIASISIPLGILGPYLP